MIFSFAIAGAILSLAGAAPSAEIHAVHERRHHAPPGWVARDAKPNAGATIPLSIGLTQCNLEKGHDLLMDVSDPNSPNYGKHWTQEEVAEAFAPSTEAVNDFKSWLLASGIADTRISLSKGSTWTCQDYHRSSRIAAED